MSDTQWSRANRAASALDTWHYGAHPDSTGYGDEGSDEFQAAALGLLVDLKHLLFRASPGLLLTVLAEEAVDVWAVEADALPEGGDEDDE